MATEVKNLKELVDEKGLGDKEVIIDLILFYG